MHKGVIIVGWIRNGKPANCGETMKNQLIINRLQQLGVYCHIIDFKNWKKHPWIFIKFLFVLIFYHKSTLIFSTSTMNSYPIMKMMKFLHWKQNIVHWVIGGTLGDYVAKGKYNKNIIGYCNWTLVESPIMVKQLKLSGINNVLQVPNFKFISYIPTQIIQDRFESSKNRKTKFVFLSRIHPQKGCNYIIEAVKKLNQIGYENKFQVDFYGDFLKSYEFEFKKSIYNINNISYKGFLNMQTNDGFDKLASYDIMLFPTFWKGEGFAGVFIDSMICGLPMIISDWAHNSQFMKDGETSIFIPVHDVNALIEKMKLCIDNKINLKYLSDCCQKNVSKYNIQNVITKELLETIGINN